MPFLILLLLAACSFSMATVLQPRILHWSQRGQDNVMKVLLGDGRRVFANHFFVKADIYFHSGYYPSIFDRNAPTKDAGHLAGREDHDEKAHEHEHEADFRGVPKDWIERFGRNFLITSHTHLEHGKEREILPWLKLSAELDPERVETYTVAAYWLRNHLGKVAEAEQFLREGLRANPQSHEILFELGRLYSDNFHDPNRARNVWELALRRWQEQEPAKKEPKKFVLEEILVNLGRLEENEGHPERAIEHLEQAKKLSPAPEALQKQIDEIKSKLPLGQTSSAKAP